MGKDYVAEAEKYRQKKNKKREWKGRWYNFPSALHGPKARTEAGLTHGGVPKKKSAAGKISEAVRRRKEIEKELKGL